MKTIRVTQRDIRTGIIGNPWHCAVAKAVSRHTNKKVVVLNDSIRLDGKDTSRTLLKLPARVRGLIKRLDAYKTVRPFAFLLEI